MKLENQVTSLELSKKLKELGVRQESLFVWWANASSCEGVAQVCHRNCGHGFCREDSGAKIYGAAYTVAELGEMLPKLIKSARDNKREEIWSCLRDQVGDLPSGVDIPTQFASTEADARAKCLEYLLENKLISVEEVNRRIEGGEG